MNYKLMNNYFGTILVLMVSFFMCTQAIMVTSFAFEDEVIEISTIEDLANMHDNLEASYVLMNDLDLAFDTSNPNGDYYNMGKGWEPIGGLGNPFKGDFNGNGYVISGLMINRSSESYVGLFGFTRGSTLTNVVLEDVDIVGNQYVGSLVGQAESTNINSISVSGIIKGTSYVGGIVGYANRTQINQVLSKASVTGNISGIGGVVGRMGRDATLKNAHSMANVSTTQCGDNNSLPCAVGGVVGQMDDISKSINSVFFKGTLTNRSNEKIEERDSKFYAKPVIGRKRGGITSGLYYHLDYSSELAIPIDENNLEFESSYDMFDFDNIWVINQTARLQRLHYFEAPVILDSIFVSRLPIQLVFDEDEIIDLAGLEVTGIYSDNSEKTIDEHECATYIDKEEQKVTITYQGLSTSFPIIINEVFYYTLSIVNHGYGGEVVVYQNGHMIEDLQRIRQDSNITVETNLELLGRVKHVLLNDIPLSGETFVMEHDSSIEAFFYLLGDLSPKLEAIFINNQEVVINHVTNQIIHSTSDKLITVKAIANADNFTISGQGNYSLEEGENRFIVSVSDEENQLSEYTLIVSYSSLLIDDGEDKSDGSKDIDELNHEKVENDEGNMDKETESTNESQLIPIPKTKDRNITRYWLFLFILGVAFVLISQIDKSITTKHKK